MQIVLIGKYEDKLPIKIVLLSFANLYKTTSLYQKMQ